MFLKYIHSYVEQLWEKSIKREALEILKNVKSLEKIEVNLNKKHNTAAIISKPAQSFELELTKKIIS